MLGKLSRCQIFYITTAPFCQSSVFFFKMSTIPQRIPPMGNTTQPGCQRFPSQPMSRNAIVAASIIHLLSLSTKVCLRGSFSLLYSSILYLLLSIDEYTIVNVLQAIMNINGAVIIMSNDSSVMPAIGVNSLAIIIHATPKSMAATGMAMQRGKRLLNLSICS